MSRSLYRKLPLGRDRCAVCSLFMHHRKICTPPIRIDVYQRIQGVDASINHKKEWQLKGHKMVRLSILSAGLAVSLTTAASAGIHPTPGPIVTA